MLRFLHTSDWQIGKMFRFLDNAMMGLLQEARLRVITRIGELAAAHGAAHVIVAGDVYDMEALSPRSLNQPLERMRNFSGVQWHLLPGNHDPHRPNGLWDQLLRKGVPDNVHVHATAAPAVLEDDGIAILPAPLHHRRTLDDPTAWMDEVDLPDGLIRIGLAHGTVTGFGSEDKEVPNYIAPDRPTRAGLSYLALGDWHGQKQISDRCWYSGTPETDGFDVTGVGQALLVEITASGAVLAVTPVPTGHYTWATHSEQVNGREDIDYLVDKLRGTAEQWIKEDKNAIKWTRLSCRKFRNNEVRLQLHALAYNLANFMRTLALPKEVEHWSLTTIREKLVKIGAKVVSHGRYVTFQMAEVAVPRALFKDILERIDRLRRPTLATA